MICLPTAGRTDDSVYTTLKQARRHLTNAGYDVDYTFYVNHDEDYLYALVPALEDMAHCEAVYFCKGWEFSKSCRIEHRIAEEYGLKILYEL